MSNDDSSNQPDDAQAAADGTDDSNDAPSTDDASWQQKVAKANREAAALRRRLKDIEDKDKSESQRATEAAQEAVARAEKAERELLRLTIASEKGLTPKQARRLTGDTEDELRADADDLVAEFGTTTSTSSNPQTRKPAEALRGGTEPDEPAIELDPDKLAAAITAQG